MKQFDTAFLTTIFPVSEIFLDDFFSSLQNQTFKNFDVIVVNNGVDNFGGIKKKYNKLNIVEILSNHCPAKNREVGINKVIENGYKYLIFGDSDDYFKKNRIEESLIILQKYDIVINDINLFNNKKIQKNFLSNQIYKKYYDIDDILDSNILGFSNSAIKVNLIKDKVIFDKELIAVDWFFFSMLLLSNNINAIFTDRTETYYRQHKQNTVGMKMFQTEKKLKFGIKTKILHYKNILNFCKEKKINNYLCVFKNKYKEILELDKQLKKDLFMIQYLSVINKNMDKIFNGWWSDVITLKEMYNYENKDK